jgi:lysophospholipase L1-like esterase
MSNTISVGLGKGKWIHCGRGLLVVLPCVVMAGALCLASDCFAQEKAAAQAKSPEELEWEKVLEKSLGFYLEGYKKAKVAGQETCWDYVKDAPKLPRVLLIGDSISRGYTLPTRHALAGKVNLHRIPCISTRTSKGLAQLDGWLGKSKWDVIHFNFGIHDRNTDTESYAANLEKIVVRLEQTGAKLIWASSTPAPETGQYAGDAAIVKRNEIAAGIMKKHNIPIDDLYGFAKPRQAELQIPGDCHFKEEKYELFGQQVAQSIIEALGK